MFVGFTKTLKRMSGFRLGFGMRINKRNWWFVSFIMLFVGMFYLMWYMIIGAGWLFYFSIYGIYKLYYWIFKLIAICCKKIYSFVKGKIDEKKAAQQED